MNASTATRRLPPRTPHRRSAVGGTLLGVFIGIIVGLGMAATVAYWLMKNNPALPLPVTGWRAVARRPCLSTAQRPGLHIYAPRTAWSNEPDRPGLNRTKRGSEMSDRPRGVPIAGVLLARHVLQLQPLSSMPVDEVVALVAPTLDRYLTGPLGSSGSA